MVATGGSSLLAIEIILKKGGREDQIHLTGIIGSVPGVHEIKARHSKVHIHLAAIDKKINKEKFIVPGLGDFGDRYFGTP